MLPQDHRSDPRRVISPAPPLNTRADSYEEKKMSQVGRRDKLNTQRQKEEERKELEKQKQREDERKELEKQKQREEEKMEMEKSRQRERKIERGRESKTKGKVEMVQREATKEN
ncbi:unnamed protein product [Urochloa humidicola]